MMSEGRIMEPSEKMMTFSKGRALVSPAWGYSEAGECGLGMCRWK